MTTDNINYKVIRSRRKTLALQISPAGEVIVRAPSSAGNAIIESFVNSHRVWIEKHLEQLSQSAVDINASKKLTDNEIKELANQAKKIIPDRVKYYSAIVGVTYGRITIRCQKTRWGSCSRDGNLNFNCLLMLAPIEVLDSVIVHELCHRKEMNHSASFYKEVLIAYPDYYKWHAWLKQNGAALQNRVLKS